MGRKPGDPTIMKQTLLMPSLALLIIGFMCFYISTPHRPGRTAINFCEAGQIHTLDPDKMTWMQDIRVAMGLWEGLAQYDPHSLKPIPGVAKSWRISADGLKYTFYLRPSARWSNGQRVTSADFLFAWKRILQPSTAAGYVTMLFHLAGAQAYFNSVATDPQRHLGFSSVGVKAPNAHELIVTLAHPCGYFLSLMAFPPFFPLNPGAMARFKTAAHGTAPVHYDPVWTRPPNLITDGPFRLAAWKFHQYLELRPNTFYWDRRAVKCSTLYIRNFPDSQSAFLAYQSGAVDVLSFVPSRFAPALLRQQREHIRDDVHDLPVFGSYYYNINCRHKPLNNPLIRRALDLAIDKQAIVKHILRVPDRALRVLVPPDSIPGYTSPRGLRMNIVQARKLLAQAGYPGGRGLPVFKFLTNSGAAINIAIAQAISAMWRKNLGVRTSIHQEESKIFNQDVVHGHYDISRAGWYGDYMDPTTWLDLYRTGNPNNLTGFSNPRLNQLLHEASYQADAVKRFALLHDAEKLLVTRWMPSIPIFQYSDGLMYNPRRIGGIYPNVRMITLLKYIHWIHARIHPSTGLAAEGWP
jgi:oligopeptide transport system substrate-binding protein